MHKQVKVLTEALIDRGWELKYSEEPVSPSYWWVHTFMTFRRGNEKIILTLLTDPQYEGHGKPIWAFAATAHEPLNRLDASRNGIVLTTGHNWENRLPGWLAAVETEFG